MDKQRAYSPNFDKSRKYIINPAFKQVTKCASEAQQNQSASVLNDEDHSREARPRRKIDLAKLQQADCHLFECRVNIEAIAKSSQRSFRHEGVADLFS
jgi:hypothetical protein